MEHEEPFIFYHDPIRLHWEAEKIEKFTYQRIARFIRLAESGRLWALFSPYNEAKRSIATRNRFYNSAWGEVAYLFWASAEFLHIQPSPMSTAGVLLNELSKFCNQKASNEFSVAQSKNRALLLIATLKAFTAGSSLTRGIEEAHLQSRYLRSTKPYFRPAEYLVPWLTKALDDYGSAWLSGHRLNREAANPEAMKVFQHSEFKELLADWLLQSRDEGTTCATDSDSARDGIKPNQSKYKKRYEVTYDDLILESLVHNWQDPVIPLYFMSPKAQLKVCRKFYTSLIQYPDNDDHQSKVPIWTESVLKRNVRRLGFSKPRPILIDDVFFRETSIIFLLNPSKLPNSKINEMNEQLLQPTERCIDGYNSVIFEMKRRR